MPQCMRNLASLWALFVLLAISLVAPVRGRHERPAARPIPAPPPRRMARRFIVHPRGVPPLTLPDAAPLPDPVWLDPTDRDPVRPYVRELERQRQRQEQGHVAGVAPSAPSPEIYGDGLDDVRAELAPLIRQLLSQSGQTGHAEVAR